jgi:SAM-dependent methyltransferase
MTKNAEDFINRLNIPSGAKVLDVACGTGNTAIPAARNGARVTGVDIAPNLLEQARARAAAENLPATFQEADAEQLPFSDAHFDLIISMFGAMFAPRPDVTANELARVCRPGGQIIMANWTAQSFAGKVFALGTKYIPPPPGIPPPVLWGEEETVRQRFAATTSEIHADLRSIDMQFPFPPHKTVELFRHYFGPTVMAFSRLVPEQQAAYAIDLENLWNAHNQSDGGNTSIRAEYLEVRAVRA